jgi:Flp pilus assembly protein TadD
MGRYGEALPDLEKAIIAYQTDPNLFRALSESCLALGDQTKADQYRKKAEQLEAEEKAKPSSPKP